MGCSSSVEQSKKHQNQNSKTNSSRKSSVKVVQQPNVNIYVALADFKTRSKQELSFHKGEHLEVISKEVSMGFI
jgi:hypothetical protein